MNTQLTEDNILKYLADNSTCPYCNSDNISAYGWHDDHHQIRCDDCFAEWREILSVIDIEEIKPPNTY